MTAAVVIFGLLLIVFTPSAGDVPQKVENGSWMLVFGFAVLTVVFYSFALLYGIVSIICTMVSRNMQSRSQLVFRILLFVLHFSIVITLIELPVGIVLRAGVSGLLALMCIHTMYLYCPRRQ